MSGWRLRPSRPDDVERLYAVWLASVVATHGFLSAGDLDAISVEVRRDYLPGAALLVAVGADDMAVGFMGQTGEEIDALFIDPGWRGRGLGRAFVERAAQEAGGALAVAVNAQNLQAVGFYQALGFLAHAREEQDDRGRPYPILKLRRPPMAQPSACET